uniref:Gag-pol polyprotein n=1 Tax=Solanum tuberosum TaxID=4113 RepID=M1AKK3_SOLTU
MPVTRRSKSIGKRVDVAAQERTSQPPPSLAVQGEAQDESLSQTSPTPPSPEDLRREVAPQEPPINATKSDPNEDPQDFIDQIQRTFDVMHVSGKEALELAAYILKGVAILWYAPNVVATMEDRVHQYVDRLDSYLVRDCTIASLNKDMDIARMQAFAQKLEDQRQKRRTQESETGHSKRARSMGQFTPSQGEFRPRFFNRPPKPSSSYSTASAPPQFQESKAISLGKEVKAKVHEHRGTKSREDMMRNHPHKGVGGVAQPTRSVVASSSSTPSLGRG